MDNDAFLLFIATFFMVSATPGLCMTLSMTLGMTIGVRKTLMMMIGELLGVMLVTICILMGMAAVLLARPNLLMALKYLAGVYLFYLGVQMWRSRGKLAIAQDKADQQFIKPHLLVAQGFITEITNPKSWAFMISLLPPFINHHESIFKQAVVLISLILILEFCCLLLYAKGGSALRQFLQKNNHVKLLNKIAGSMMMLVSVWLVVGS